MFDHLNLVNRQTMAFFNAICANPRLDGFHKVKGKIDGERVCNALNSYYKERNLHFIALLETRSLGKVQRIHIKRDYHSAFSGSPIRASTIRKSRVYQIITEECRASSSVIIWLLFTIYLDHSPVVDLCHLMRAGLLSRNRRLSHFVRGFRSISLWEHM